MPKFEYAISQVNWCPSVEDAEVEKYLNSMGIMGWELVSETAEPISNIARVRYLWKRERV